MPQFRYYLARGVKQPADAVPGALRRIQITIIDKEGIRHTFRGMEGDKLVDVLEANEDSLGGHDGCERSGGWKAALYEEGVVEKGLIRPSRCIRRDPVG